jgi:hypothetical protein
MAREARARDCGSFLAALIQSHLITLFLAVQEKAPRLVGNPEHRDGHSRLHCARYAWVR